MDVLNISTQVNDWWNANIYKFEILENQESRNGFSGLIWFLSFWISSCFTRQFRIFRSKSQIYAFVWFNGYIYKTFATLLIFEFHKPISLLHFCFSLFYSCYSTLLSIASICGSIHFRNTKQQRTCFKYIWRKSVRNDISQFNRAIHAKMK